MMTLIARRKRKTKRKKRYEIEQNVRTSLQRSDWQSTFEQDWV